MEQIMPYLEQLANKMGVAVTHLWEILIRQSIVNGISNLIWGASFFIVVVFICMTFKPFLKHIHDKYNCLKTDRIKNGTGYANSYTTSSMSEDFWHSMKTAYPIIISICLTVCVFISLGNFTAGIKHIVNPEYYAIQQVLDVIK
jgi:hypothetical protein